MILYNFDSGSIFSDETNNWELCRNDISLQEIISFSYQTRVTIKNSHVGQ